MNSTNQIPPAGLTSPPIFVIFGPLKMLLLVWLSIFIVFLTGMPALALKPVFSIPVALAFPVRITVFTAKYNAVNQVVNLHWVTTMEKNNEHFIVERSLDSIHFVSVGKAKSVGNSHSAQHYYFDDPKPVGGKLYYRLREIDSDEKQFLTTVVSIVVPITRMELTAVELSDSGMELNFAIVSPEASTATVLVADIGGKVLKSYFITLKEGANLKSIYTGNLKAGIYFLQVNDKKGGGSLMEKFILPADKKRSKR